MESLIVSDQHPLDELIRSDRMPHIWCPGCGIGIVMRCYAHAIACSGIDPDRHVVVSGIGCSGRVAVGLKLANPELEVTVFSGDGDLAAIGGNHLIHAARRNADINVICTNNFNYGMTGGQLGPTTPLGVRTTTSPYGSPEHPFNLMFLLAAAGANFVSRWTAIHARQVRDDILYAFNKSGFSFLEVLVPCPVGFGKSNQMEEGLDELMVYRDRCVLGEDMPLEGLGIDFSSDQPIYVGRFVDQDAPPYTPIDRRPAQ